MPNGKHTEMVVRLKKRKVVLKSSFLIIFISFLFFLFPVIYLSLLGFRSGVQVLVSTVSDGTTDEKEGVEANTEAGRAAGVGGGVGSSLGVRTGSRVAGLLSKAKVVSGRRLFMFPCLSEALNIPRA